jgi:hypothetical protein
MHQAVLPSALAISSIAVMNVSGSISSPPTLRGSSILNRRASCNAARSFGVSAQPRSTAGASASISGCNCRALRTGSAVWLLAVGASMFITR